MSGPSSTSTSSTLAASPPHVPPTLVVDFDMYHPGDVNDEVHVAWKRIQGTTPPIFWTPRNGGHWVATRGEDIKHIQLDHEHFSMGVTTIPARGHRHIPINLDPPEHGPYRKLIMPAFLPKALQPLEGRAREVARSLIDGFIGKGECEFINDFARVLPVVIFLEMVDLPAEDRTLLLPLAEAVVRNPDRAVKEAAQKTMEEYLGKWIEERTRNPGDDLLSTVIHSQIDGRPLTSAEILSICTLLLFGGLDTVASMMGFVARFLAISPAHRRRLRDDPKIRSRAMEEMLRRHGISNTARIITMDFEYKGVKFKKGDLIQQPGVLYGLDESIVPNPMEVDFDRKPPIPHVAFGSGPHVCPGQNLARRELRVFIEEWLERIPDFEIKRGTRPEFASGLVNSMTRLELIWPTASVKS